MGAVTLKLDEPITNLHGDSIWMDGARCVACQARLGEVQQATLRSICVTALLGSFGGDTPSAQDKVRRFELARSIQAAGGSLDVAVEDAALIKQMVGGVCNTLVTGRVHQLIEEAGT